MKDSLIKDLDTISSPTMADVVEDKLREFFKKRSFKPGDALPKELELAAALGVSRNIVREALSRLKMLGMIESKKRRGMILAKPDILGSFERVMDPLIMDKDTLQNIFELRLVLEMGLADMLFIRKTAKDIKELEKIAKNEKTDDAIFRINHEIDFHGKLYEMTGNDTMKRFQSMLLPVFEYVIKTTESFRYGKVNHLGLVEALKYGTKDEFRNAMWAHLLPHFEHCGYKKK